MTTDRALLVGISDYGPCYPAQFRPGCVFDVGDWLNLLIRTYKFQVGDKNLRILLNSAATKPAVSGGLEWLLHEAEETDRRVFVFAGHGTRYYTRQDGEDFWEEAIVLHPVADEPLDQCRLNDDSLTNIVVSSTGSSNARVTVIIDACFAGGLGDFERTSPAEKAEGLRFVETGSQDSNERTANTRALEGRTTQRVFGSFEKAVIDGGLIPLVIAASQADKKAFEDSLDGVVQGVFSYFAKKIIVDNSAIKHDSLIEEAGKLMAKFNGQQPALLGNLARRTQAFLD